METTTISVRVPKSVAARWTKLAREAGLDRATLFRQALRTGCASTLFDRACAAYRHGEITLARAAEWAGLSQRDMLMRLTRAGLEIHYDARDLAQDLAP